jgi:hypothetical protein
MVYMSNKLNNVADILKRQLGVTAKIPTVLRTGRPVAMATA